MNLEIHNPELVQRLNAHLEAGRFHNADELIETALNALDERMPEAPSTESAAGPAGEPFWKSFTNEVHALADEVFDRLPEDGASQHDHYLYGAPKRDA